MPGPGAYWFGQEEFDAVNEVAAAGHLFRYGREEDELACAQAGANAQTPITATP
jgi:hypothetical protein